MSLSILKGFLHLICLWTILRISVEGTLLCNPPPTIENAINNASKTEDASYPIGTVILYTCDDGYVFRSGKNTIKCDITNGANIPRWSTTTFRCIPQTCPDPGGIPNGVRQGHVFTFPNRVTYSCNEGYELYGVRSRYCAPDGRWTGSTPECRIIHCPELEDISNGRVVYQSTEFRSVARYECSNGYILNGTETRTCQSNRTWSFEPPVCKEVACPEPRSPERGSFELINGNTKLGSVVLFSCNPGTTLLGSTSSKCLKAGVWSFPEPQCLPSCKIPEFSDGIFGTIQEERRYYVYNKKYFLKAQPGSTWEEGNTLLVRCNEGYAFKGTTDSLQRQVTCRGGSWDNLVECVPASCTNPPRIWNGKPEKNIIAHGEAVEYSCDDGFTLEGPPRKMLCLFGKFDGRAPACQKTKANCTNPPTIWNGKAEKDIIAHGEFVKYSCDEGFIIRAPSSINCQFGDYVGKPPACEKHRVSLDCIIPRIDGGYLKAHRWNGRYWNWQVIPPGEKLPGERRAELYCGGKWSKWIKCVKGEWDKPVTCGNQGHVAVPAIAVPTEPSSASVNLHGRSDDPRTTWPKPNAGNGAPRGQPTIHPVINSPSRNNEEIAHSTQKPLNKPENAEGIPTTTVLENVSTAQSSTEDKTTCILPQIPELLVAHSNFQRVSSGSEIPSGREVFFNCKDIGKHIFKGLNKWSCENGNWSSTELPSCTNATGTYPIILLSKSDSGVPVIGQEGHIFLQHPNQQRFLCLSANGKGRVIWEVGSSASVEINTTDLFRSNVHILVLDLSTNNEDGVVEIKCTSELNGDSRSLIINVKASKIPTEMLIKPEVTFPQITTTQLPSTELPLADFSSTSSTEIGIRTSSSAPTGSPDATVSRVEEETPFFGTEVGDGITELPNITTGTSQPKPCVFWLRDESLEGFLPNGVHVYTGDNVSHGEVVMVHCRHIGIQRLKGAKSIRCDNSRWQPLKTRFSPKCNNPQNSEDPVIFFDIPQNRYHIGPGGLLTILRSTTIDLRCVSGANRWPTWTLKRHWKFNQAHNDFENRRQTKVEIVNAQVEHSGVYTCKVGRKEHSIILDVVDGCDVSDVYDVVPIINVIPRLEYDRRFLSVGEKLELTCENNHVLQGNGTLVCLSRGMWSAPHPIKCVPGCPPPVTDDPIMQIKGLKSGVYEFGDDLVFECPSGFVLSTPYVRIFCVNGKWSEKEIPRCINIDDIGRSN